jgi:chromosome segregation ATPase
MTKKEQNRNNEHTETNTGDNKQQKMLSEGKRYLDRFGKFISDKLFAPSVLTVFLTAILGPIAIKWVNDSFENKKLQKEVISTIISYTNDADFSKPESIEKIAIISQMVNENKEIFGLSFEQTNGQIRQLNEASNDVGIKNLTQKKDEYEENLKLHQAAYEADTIQLLELQKQKEDLKSELERYKNINNKIKIGETQNKLALNRIEIEDYQKDRDFRREQIKYWKEQIAVIENYIEDAGKDLAKVMQQNRNTQQILKQEKGELQEELAKRISEIQMMTTRINQLEKMLQKKTDSLSLYKAKEMDSKNQ